jgi:UDP-glucose 4-epimerase
MAVCLIAGGAGFVGSHLAQALVARGDTVRIVDNFSESSPENLAELGPRVDVVPGDLRSHSLVRRAMAGVDTVFHFAVPWGLAAPGPVHGPAAGAVGTWHLLLAARDAGCRRVVLASTGEVYGRTNRPVHEDTPAVPSLPAAKDAMMAEQEAISFARAFGLALVRLRFFNVYGPRQGLRAAGPNVRRILDALLAGKRPVLYDHELGEQDLLYVADAVRGCLLAADRDRAAGQVYHLASGRITRAQHIVSRLNALLGTEIPPLLAGPCSTSPPAPLPDVTRARAELGFVADTSLDQGLRNCVSYYRPDNEEFDSEVISPSQPADVDCGAG